jgi:hypothetical protein
MNERIKQLAKDSGYYLYDLTETHECKTVETDSKDEWITLEKFAGLIVKECCDVLQTETIRHDGYGYNQGFLHKKIKQHFGVEQ